MVRWWAYNREVYYEYQKELVLRGDKVRPLFMAHSVTMASRAVKIHNDDLRIAVTVSHAVEVD